jgi:hypothetical protein
VIEAQRQTDDAAHRASVNRALARLASEEFCQRGWC